MCSLGHRAFGASDDKAAENQASQLKYLNSAKRSIIRVSNEILEKDISSSPRIGVDYAGRDAKLLYRFYIKNNKWVSK